MDCCFRNLVLGDLSPVLRSFGRLLGDPLPVQRSFGCSLRSHPQDQIRFADLVARPGLEPGNSAPKADVLPITLPGSCFDNYFLFPFVSFSCCSLFLSRLFLKRFLLIVVSIQNLTLQVITKLLVNRVC